MIYEDSERLADEIAERRAELDRENAEDHVERELAWAEYEQARDRWCALHGRRA